MYSASDTVFYIYLASSFNKGFGIPDLQVTEINRHAIKMSEPRRRTRAYSCPRCGYTTNRIHNFKTHCNARRQCPPLVADVSRPSPCQAIQYVVGGSDNTLTSSFPLSNHSTIAVSDMIADLRRDLFAHVDMLREQVDRLRNQIDRVLLQEDADESSSCSSSSSRHQDTVIILPEQGMRVLDFGHEDIEDLFDDLHELFLKKSEGLLYVLEKTFFNPAKPLNHNVRISNLKHGIAETMQSGQWTSMRITKAIENIIRRAQDILFHKYQMDAQYREMISEHHQDVFDWQISLIARERRTYNAVAGDVKSLLIDRYKLTRNR